MERDSAIHDKITAIHTYIGASFSERFFVSVTTADIPLKKQFLSAAFLIAPIASMVESAEVVSSKIIAINVASP